MVGSNRCKFATTGNGDEALPGRIHFAWVGSPEVTPSTSCLWWVKCQQRMKWVRSSIDGVISAVDD